MITREYKRTIIGASRMKEGVFTVRMDPDRQKQLDAIAQQLDRSRNYGFVNK